MTFNKIMSENSKSPRTEQFSGCLIGQCLGDALGCPVEGFSASECQDYVEQVLKAGHFPEYSRGQLSFGQYTDDSQLARELLQSYVACRRFDPQDYAKRIAAIFAEGRIVGYGQATVKAARYLIQGVHWEEAGTPPPAAGNGSAMRAGLIGLMFFDDPQQLIQAAHDQGRITHQDRRCSAGAVAIAGAVALVLQRQSIDPHQFLSQLSDWTVSIKPTFADSLRQLIGWSFLSPEQAVQFIATSGLSSYDFNPSQGITPFVVSSVLWSLYSFLRTPEDYWETICTAISMGGDVDTMAAMAGAISGAYLGLEGISSHLSHLVTDRGSWNYEELVKLANQSYELKMFQE